MAGKYKILAIDQDRATWSSMREALEDKGYSLVIACSAEEGLNLLHQENIALALIHNKLHDTDHLELIRDIKDTYVIPVIVVSEKNDTTEKIVGLEIGADDYLCKPFEEQELAARVKATLRLVEDVEEKKEKELEVKKASVIHFGHWYLDLNRHELLNGDKKPLDMTAGEIEMLTAFVRSPRKTLTRDQLFDLTREREYEGFDRAVDVQISRIRQKIGDDTREKPFIKTVRGVGYMLDTETKVIE